MRFLALSQVTLGAWSLLLVFLLLLALFEHILETILSHLPQVHADGLPFQFLALF